jgi:hypothetical protein
MLKNLRIVCLIVLCFVIAWSFTGCGGGGKKDGGEDVDLTGTWDTSLVAEETFSEIAGTYENKASSHIFKLIVCSSGKAFTYFHNYMTGYREFGYGLVGEENYVDVRTIGHLPGQVPVSYRITGAIDGSVFSFAWENQFFLTAQLKNTISYLEDFAGEYTGVLYKEEGEYFLSFGVGTEGSIIGITMNENEEQPAYGGAHGTVGPSGIVFANGFIIDATELSMDTLNFSGVIFMGSAYGTFLTQPYPSSALSDIKDLNSIDFYNLWKK